MFRPEGSDGRCGLVFFFSSRRRHTRCGRDWSSDVCSSDLIVYSRSGGKDRLARLYQPAGSGPFPAVLQVHGGAWNNKDRTDGQNTALDLCEIGRASCRERVEITVGGSALKKKTNG